MPIRRFGYEEDKLITSDVEAMGIGKEISEELFLNLEWIDEMDNLEKYRSKFDELGAKFRDDGLMDAVEAIGEVAL